MKLLRKSHERKLLRFAIPYINKAKRASLPGFDKVPIYNVALFFYRGIKDGDLNNRASSAAYSLMLALFPAILFLFTLIPVVPIANFQEELLELIESLMPESVYDAVNRIIIDIITIKHGGILSVGFVLAAVFSTNGIVRLIQSFNASVNVEETRSWLMQRAIAILLVFILALLITVAVVLIIVTQRLMNLLVLHDFMQQDWTYYLVTVGKWVVIIAFFYFAYSFLYYLGPARKSKYRFITAGATLATLLSILLTVGFGFYIDHFGRYNALYGSIGTLPVIMLIVYLNCMAILVGFELNIGIVAARKIHAVNLDKRKK
ncbi:MAG: YihY/virulence factor BrkB family protein [Prolixibacteraceae bacterium]|nr:YihY/virulence factor BrkB family protein [Prolixibacteraceae bacterium]MBN2648423.1 YihY/virulence factor BrkB family protein [Prolixibacteraceae bacterium]